MKPMSRLTCWTPLEENGFAIIGWLVGWLIRGGRFVDGAMAFPHVGIDHGFVAAFFSFAVFLFLFQQFEAFLPAVLKYFVESGFVIAEQPAEEGVLIEWCVAGIEFGLEHFDAA